MLSGASRARAAALDERTTAVIEVVAVVDAHFVVEGVAVAAVVAVVREVVVVVAAAADALVVAGAAGVAVEIARAGQL